MLPQIIPFVTKHWQLCSALVAILILLVIEEMRSARAKGVQLSPAGVTHAINREDAVLIDLRETPAFREGHIIGAKNFPLSEFDRLQEKLNSYKERPLILIDAMGLKVAPIVLRLKTAEFKNISSLKGGMDAWTLANMPVTKK